MAVDVGIIMGSQSDWATMKEAAAILDELGSDTPRRLIGNQIDRCPAGALEQARALDPLVLFVSATAGLGLEGLRDWLFSEQPPVG